MKPSQLLGRVLRDEVDVSALLGYLTLLDPDPLQHLLQLPQQIHGARVEVQNTKSSRLDVVLDGDDGPLAVLELKVSATEHGKQLSRYNKIAAEHDAQCFLLDLELPGTEVPEGWRRVNLAEVFACWSASSNPTARELGVAIAGVFTGWREQATGVLAKMDPAMYTVVLRRLREGLADEGYKAYSRNTNAGQPSLTAYAPHPSGHERAFVSVDIRCQDKKDRKRPWHFRVGVAVDKGDDVVADRHLAHDLAMQVAPALTLRGLRESLMTSAEWIKDAIGGDKPLKPQGDQGHRIDRWLRAVDAAGTGSVGQNHPVFYHDSGLRLAAQFTLDPTCVTTDQLQALVDSTLTYLAEHTGVQR